MNELQPSLSGSLVYMGLRAPIPGSMDRSIRRGTLHIARNENDFKNVASVERNERVLF